MKSIFIIIILVTSVCSFGQESFQVVSGCQEADYVLADVQSSIATQGHSYTPKCLKVIVGSVITIAASKKHPLAPQSATKANNPISFTESTKAYEFNVPGIYGYFCTDHGTNSGSGMAGSIWVVESL